jgi:hypothetical protein
VGVWDLYRLKKIKKIERRFEGIMIFLILFQNQQQELISN